MSNQDDMAGMPGMSMTPPAPKGDLKNTTDGAMSSSLTWTTDVTVLFRGWPDDSVPMYVLALFFVFLLAVAVEVLSVSPKHKPGTKTFICTLTQTGVYTFRTALAYLVMLAVMSFNTGILIAAVAGHALGFFIIKVRSHGLQPNVADPKV
ncbi:hypothetical protein PRUPE_6G265500 [Prunus persica]|uniref:Copper transport protein n=3 Tax=Prunus TaxID=3754 RepID=A0A5E4FB86_PRUDU|nr:PREDICTED: copper transporter 6-like [Prunus mume]XP_020422100.1 copper transporter 6-like [Prunus persica]XP_034219746.1 copper transporter 6-like [Prunus dulcis]KAI5325757.1 hypothetical protein L3X38_034831 [Prunus dulcis]ONI03566.1 hypothetical protein PRUPE_6G265500 [Prunus persica]VVA25384.1 PREDICTED: copper [Prunus dulcis]